MKALDVDIVFGKQRIMGYVDLISSSVVSDVGKKYAENEDNYYLNGVAGPGSENWSSDSSEIGPDGYSLFAVCDGMGGEEHGAIASMTAVQALSRMKKSIQINDIQRFLKEINNSIVSKRKELKSRNMGCTIAALCILDGSAVAFNVGDSRVYLFRNQELRQLSEDHNEKYDRHALTQYLGVSPTDFIIEPFVSDVIQIKRGDAFLICSDGITDMISEDEIRRIMLRDNSAEDLSQELVESALRNGGMDNATAMVVRVS